MSGASEAVALLLDTAQRTYAETFDTGGHFARAHVALRRSSDIVDALARTIDMLVAAEALLDAAEGAVKSLRETLGEVMQDTGATTIQATHHAAHLSRKPAFLSIADETAIPREYYTTPPPALDKRALMAAVRDGVEVPGVSIATPNAMSLVLRSKQKEAVA